MSYEKERYILCKMVENSISRKISTPADFQFLSGIIQERCKETLGNTTLKRIWGYVEGYGDIRNSTLSILARAIGFQDWENFLNTYEIEGESSQSILGNAVFSSDIEKNSIIQITWAPDRRVTIKHISDGNYVVIKSENSKLCEGDTFHCGYFLIGQPIYLDNYVHNGRNPVFFIAGKKGRISTIEQKNKI